MPPHSLALFFGGGAGIVAARSRCGRGSWEHTSAPHIPRDSLLAEALLLDFHDQGAVDGRGASCSFCQWGEHHHSGTRVCWRRLGLLLRVCAGRSRRESVVCSSRLQRQPRAHNLQSTTRFRVQGSGYRVQRVGFGLGLNFPFALPTPDYRE